MSEQHNPINEHWAVPAANVFRVIAPDAPHENQPSGLCPPYPWAIVCDTDPGSVGGPRAAGCARRIVAMGNVMRGIATEHLGLIPDLIREARRLAGECKACGGYGRLPTDVACLICGPMRALLANLEGTP